MTVTTCPVNLFQKRQELKQFLLDCQQISIDKNHPQIVSISVEIQSVDPLAALRLIHQPEKPHFYFEKGSQSQAIAASGVAVDLKVEGPQRFLLARDFIYSWLANTITIGELDLPFSGPHFFCSFTFFDQKVEISPFSAATVFLPRWQIARHKSCYVAVANLQVSAGTNTEVISRDLWQNFQTISSLKWGTSDVTSNYDRGYSKRDIVDVYSFKQSVLSVLKLIQAGDLNKIVLAHAVDVISPVPFHLFDSLNNLRKLHPDCYVFSTSNGRQSFIGASPERLISIHNHELSTDALAGSAPRGKTTLEDAYFAHSLLCSEKEMREHRAVTDFIAQCLSRFGIAPQMSPLPHLLQLSNIQHMQTPIRAKVPPNLHLLELLAELHPTPAVAGTPRNYAEAQIRRYETFERSLYAAPLGWVDHRGNGEFAVGIRSALIDGAHARLYAGAGIVAGSDPSRELAEIKLKLQTLLEALV